MHKEWKRRGKSVGGSFQSEINFFVNGMTAHSRSMFIGLEYCDDNTEQCNTERIQNTCILELSFETSGERNFLDAQQ